MKSNMEHKLARKHDVSKHLRSYEKRYGGLSVLDIVQIRKKVEQSKKQEKV